VARFADEACRYDLLTRTAIEAAHATRITIETGRVTERGSGFRIDMERVEAPIPYRHLNRSIVEADLQVRLPLPQCPREESLGVIQGNLSAEPVRQRVKRMFSPRDLQQD